MCVYCFHSLFHSKKQHSCIWNGKTIEINFFSAFTYNRVIPEMVDTMKNPIKSIRLGLSLSLTMFRMNPVGLTFFSFFFFADERNFTHDSIHRHSVAQSHKIIWTAQHLQRYTNYPEMIKYVGLRHVGTLVDVGELGTILINGWI